MDAPKHKYHMLSDINEQPFPLNLLAEIGLSNQFSDAKQCTADIRKGLAAALSTLDEKEELAILLRYRHGYKLDEIAEQLKATKEWARITIKNALDKLSQPFARNLIECGIMGYIEHQAEEKADEIVRERLSKEYLRGYETGRHDTTIAKESSVVFDFADFDLSSFDTAAEFSVVGIESMRDLLYPVALSSIHDALKEQVRHCYLSREAYHEVIECLNENGFEINPQDDIKPDIAYLPEFFSHSTVENDEDDNSAVDKEHQLALNYVSWMFPRYIEEAPAEIQCHIDDKKYFLETGKYDIPPTEIYDGEVSFYDQKTVFAYEIFPYNLLRAVFGKWRTASYIFPNVENYLNRIVDSVLSTLQPQEEGIIRLIYQYNFTVDDLLRVANTGENITATWGICKRFQQVSQKAVRKLRHPSRSKRLNPFFCGNPVKLHHSLRVYDEAASFIASSENVMFITEQTDFVKRLIRHTSEFSLDKAREVYLTGKALDNYDSSDLQNNIDEIFPSAQASFRLLNDTINHKRIWRKWDTLWLNSFAVKGTVSELSDLSIKHAWFSILDTEQYWMQEYGYWDEKWNHVSFKQIDRILLIETEQNEKKLFWWYQDGNIANGKGNVNITPYPISSKIIENLYSHIAKGLRSPLQEDAESKLINRMNEAEYELHLHYDLIPDSMIHDTITNTRQWCEWPIELVSKSLMGLPRKAYILKAFFGLGVGNFGETLKGMQQSISTALFLELSTHEKKLFWFANNGKPEYFKATEEFLERLSRLLVLEQHLLEAEISHLQKTLHQTELAFSSYCIEYGLPEEDSQIFTEYQNQLTPLKAPSSVLDRKYEMTIDELDMSVRASMCLKRAGIDTVGKLCEKTEEDLMRVRNMGKKPLEEIEEKLQQYGLALRKPKTPAEVQAKLDELGS